MRDSSDMDLVRDYIRLNSEAAFAELVQRHIALVYSAALRRVGISAHAEEITQAVFIILARKAAGLRSDTILEGWLYETTRLTALSFVRGEHRRQFREQEAYMQSTLQESSNDPAWQQLSPLLDEAMSRLGKKDRDAVLLRFFKEKNVREVAAAMQVNETAAQRRILRALEKLRKFFTRRGVSSTTAIIAGVIAANSVQAAPVALAKTVTAVAIAKGAAASGSTLTLIKGALKIMAWTKAKTAIVAGVAILAASTTTVVVDKIVHKNSWADDPKFWETDSSALAKAPAGAFIFRPTHFPKTGGSVWDSDRISAKNCSVSELVNVAYGFSYVRTILPPAMPREHFDVMSTVTGGYSELLKKELKTRFLLTAHTETRPADVLLLKVQNPNPPGLKPHSGTDGNSSWIGGNRKTTIRNQQFDGFFGDIESRIGRPVINETGLTGKYDLEIQWQPRRGETDKDAYVRALREQLGLELVPSREPIEMLVVEKVN